MKKTSGTKSQKRPRRTKGPRILMTSSEYAEAKRLAKKDGRSLSSYLRIRALNHRLGKTYSPEEIEHLRKAGLRLNEFVRTLHIYPNVASGSARRGRIHVDDVATELGLLRDTLSSTPRKTWRYPVKQFPRGDGKRVNRGIVRCTPEEYAKIKGRMSEVKMKEATFIRALVFNYPIGKATFDDMEYQVERIRNNLMQMKEIREWESSLETLINELLSEVNTRWRELLFGRKH